MRREKSRRKQYNEKAQTRIVCGLILVLGIVSFMQNHYDTYWKKSQIMTVITVNGCESQTPEAQLQIKLEKAVEDYMNLGQMIKTAPCYSTEDALDCVLQYDAEITTAAQKYGVEKAMIQAVLFQELRFYGIEDPVADAWVAMTYAEEDRRAENGSGTAGEASLFRMIRKQDSSTGIAQIYAKTAIEAHNWKYGTEYDPADIATLEQFWMGLQDDTCCIDTEAMVLAKIMDDRQVSIPLTEDETGQVMARYNGTNGWAQKYGEVTARYYAAFQEYDEID